MRWCIVGAGAVGGVLGARMHLAGERVELVARGSHLDAIRRGGLVLVDGAGEHQLDLPVAGSIAAADVGPDTTVVLAVKSQHTAGVLDELAAAAPEARVVCAQNGIENERRALRLFELVYSMSVSLLATHLEPGVVIAHSAPLAGSMHLGRHGQWDEYSDSFVNDAAQALRRAGFAAEVHADIMRYKYGKLLINLGNGVEALCGPGARDGALAGLVHSEGRRCLDAAGIAAVEGEALTPLPDGSRVVVPRSGGSSWQSLHRGAGSSETDYLNGEIVLLGRLFAVPTPANALVQREMRDLSLRGGQPGSVAESVLLNQLG